MNSYSELVDSFPELPCMATRHVQGKHIRLWVCMLFQTIMDLFMKNIHKCAPCFLFPASVYLLIINWKQHFTPFFSVKHATLQLSLRVCVFGCLSAQRETDAVFASSRDKGSSMITISESESEGDLITPPTSRHDRLPSVWRAYRQIISSGPSTFHTLEMLVGGFQVCAAAAVTTASDVKDSMFPLKLKFTKIPLTCFWTCAILERAWGQDIYIFFPFIII